MKTSDQDSERALVQAAYLQPDLVQSLGVDERWFTQADYRTLWRVIGELDGLSPDAQILATRARLPLSQVYEVVDNALTALNAEYYAKIVKNCAVRRTAQLVIGRGYDGIMNGKETEDVLGSLSSELVRVVAGTAGKVASMHDVLGRVINFAEKEWAGDTQKLVTGIYRLDSITGGMYPGELIVLGARTSVGKSALALQLAMELAANSVPVSYVSLEMSNEALGRRMVASTAQVSAGKLRGGQDGEKLTQEDLAKIMAVAPKMAKLPLVFADRIGRKLSEVLMWLRADVAKRQTRLAVIDYLTLIEPDDHGVDRWVHVGQVTAALKQVAQRHGMVILAPTQLSRQAEKSGLPALADLRESGNIEQDADQVWLLHRKRNSEGLLEDDAMLYVAKHREGATGAVKLRFVAGWTRFVEVPLDTHGTTV